MNATATNTIGEIASPEIRGSLVGIYLIFFYCGAIFQGIICAVWSSYHLLTYCVTGFSTLYFVVMYWSMESPNYLLSISKHEEAWNNLKRIRPGYAEEDISIEFQKMDDYITAERKQKSEVNWAKFLRSKAIRVPLLTCLFLNFLTIMTGINLLGSYTTLIIPDNGYIGKKYYPLIMQILLFIPTVLTPFYMDKFARRTLYLFGAGTACVVQLCNGISYYFYGSNGTSFFKWTFIFGNLIMNGSYGGTLGPTNSAIKSELFPQSVKGLGGSLSIIAQATATIICYKLYHLMSQNYLHMIYILFGLDALLLAVVVYYTLPEGRGKLLSDLQMVTNTSTEKPKKKNVEKP